MGVKWVEGAVSDIKCVYFKMYVINRAFFTWRRQIKEMGIKSISRRMMPVSDSVHWQDFPLFGIRDDL